MQIAARLLLMSALLGTTSSVQAQTNHLEEWKLALSGWWDELTSDKRPCGSEANLHQHEFSADGKRVTWKFQKPLGEESLIAGRLQYSYKVIEISAAHLRLELEEVPASSEQRHPRVWDLVLVDRGTFRWKAANWRVGAYNDVWGIRCKAS